jgi:thioredoxin reductase (NADPH)
MTSYDAIIVGAGPAGLTAATYLGRFRRRVLILDGGLSRASWIPESHNTPGFPQGVGGEALLQRLGHQAQLYGAERRVARADALTRTEDGFELTLDASDSGPKAVRARFAILATGVVDRLPGLAHIEMAIRKAQVRVCPICDAYEAIDQRIAVLGDGDLGAREAMFLTTYSSRVTLLHLGPISSLSDEPALRARGVEVLPVVTQDISVGGDAVVVNDPGQPRAFDCLYLALGCETQNRLATRWNAQHDAEGNLLVNAHQETSIDGVYAAGDVVRGLNQIAVATAEAAIAATDIHRRLRAMEASAGHADVRPRA